VKIVWMRSALGRKAGQIEEVADGPDAQLLLGRRKARAAAALRDLFGSGLAEPAEPGADVAEDLAVALDRCGAAAAARKDFAGEQPEDLALLEERLAEIRAGG
jgi:hypothetical protein